MNEKVRDEEEREEKKRPDYQTAWNRAANYTQLLA
jgi:hypothetical protein